jgi:hypothetical protein
VGKEGCSERLLVAVLQRKSTKFNEDAYLFGDTRQKEPLSLKHLKQKLFNRLFPVVEGNVLLTVCTSSYLGKEEGIYPSLIVYSHISL